MRRFGEAQTKVMRAYAQSGQYHTIVESRVRLIRLISFLRSYEFLSFGPMNSFPSFLGCYKNPGIIRVVHRVVHTKH